MPPEDCSAPVALGILTIVPVQPVPRSSRSASGQVKPTRSGTTMGCCCGRAAEVDGSALVDEMAVGGVFVGLPVSDAQAAAAIAIPPATKAALIRTSSMLARKQRGDALRAKLQQ